MRSLSSPKIALLGVLALFVSCIDPEPQEAPLTAYEPIVMDRADMKNNVAFLPARAMKHTGKIVFKDNFLFIIEAYEGVHVIDNSTPENPVKVGFMRIPGCSDVALKGQYLYADNGTDLITIDLSDASHPHVVNRQANVFPEPPPPDLQRVPAQYDYGSRDPKLVIIGWTKR